MYRKLSLAIIAALAFPIAVQAQSTNPDTPTTLKTNTIIAHFRKEHEQPPRYFTFAAGPGTVKLRLTLRPNSDGETGYATLSDVDGNQLLRVGDGTSNDHDSIKTATTTLPEKKTLVLKIEGNALFYGNRHPTLRVQLDGDVLLDKTAKPLSY
jgi:hypothetical protein